ncbi:MAG: hypothetical protein V1492_00195 [Candidatus Micrarchaeota archaeon]
METIKKSHLNKQIEKKPDETTATTRKTVFARLKERFGHALKDDVGQAKTSTAKIFGTVALVFVTTIGGVKCGSDVAEPSPTEDVGGKSDANGVHEKDGGKDAGKDVGHGDREDLGDVEVPDGGPNGSKDGGPDVEVRDGESDGPIDTDGGDQEVKDGGDVNGDTGPTDTCDNVVHKDTFTDVKESKNVTTLDGETITVNYYSSGEEETLCGEVQSNRVDKLKIEFDPPLVSNQANPIAKKAVEFEILGQKLEMQRIASLPTIIAITKRVFWEKNGPFSPELSTPFEVEKQAFKCISITDTSANFQTFAGGISMSLSNMKPGDFGCRDPPIAPQICGKLYIVDKQRNNGDGYIAGITSDTMGIGFNTGDLVTTKTLSWQMNGGLPVQFDKSNWTTTAINQQIVNDGTTVTITLIGFTIERQK